MNDTSLVQIGLQAMLIAAKLCAPALLTALVVGFAVSLFQSATQIQEFTLSFVPKAIAVCVAMLLCGSWMIHSMITYTEELFRLLPSLLD